MIDALSRIDINVVRSAFTSSAPGLRSDAAQKVGRFTGLFETAFAEFQVTALDALRDSEFLAIVRQ